MDISKLYNRIAGDRDHEARMCAEYCRAGLWDLAAERARVCRALDEKLTAILEGRGADYGINPDRRGDDQEFNVIPIRDNSASL